MAYSLAQLNDAVRTDPQGFVQECDAAYNKKIDSAARKIADNLKKSRIVLLSGPSGSGKTTTAKKIEARLEQMGINSHAVSMDNFWPFAFASLNVTDVFFIIQFSFLKNKSWKVCY